MNDMKPSDIRYRLAVLGQPIAHSLSPHIHRYFAFRFGLQVTYEKIETSQSELPERIKRLAETGYSGFNCTMPLKTEMASLADVLSEHGRLLRACNTVTVRDGLFYGDTTDGGGMMCALENKGHVLYNKNILMIGAGGAARPVALALRQKGIRNLWVANRSRDSADALDRMLSGGISRFSDLTPGHLSELASQSDIIINMTPLGKAGCEDFEDFSFLDSFAGVVCDAVYNPLETSLLRRAGMRGLETVDGLHMLIGQAALAFEIWTGCPVDAAAAEEIHGQLVTSDFV